MIRVLELENKTVIERNSYIVSYPHILSYFSTLDDVKVQDFVRGAHMIYGWMPTVLTMHIDQTAPNVKLEEAAFILTNAKRNHVIVESQINNLAAIVNNSVVGASKLLHFVAPEHFAIWDSKIYSYIYHKKPYSYRVNNSKSYLQYLEKLKELKKHVDFPQFHHRINQKIGYDVSTMRAIELVMFLNAKNA